MRSLLIGSLRHVIWLASKRYRSMALRRNFNYYFVFCYRIMEKSKLSSHYDYLDVSQENDEYIFRIKQMKDESSALIILWILFDPDPMERINRRRRRLPKPLPPPRINNRFLWFIIRVFCSVLYWLSRLVHWYHKSRQTRRRGRH
ncbi:hypothetical protein AVEN_198211-1 [Araneus ventricosus]|uniref:Uncharacterized protein n=1 Tax=Araneus ventricosus TaxID=182803 RepID=A0A4Y2E480_ARAVE|nr:hypothetical protein AVEN_198211-1 [Araneus ventricosus]